MVLLRVGWGGGKGGRDSLACRERGVGVEEGGREETRKLVRVARVWSRVSRVRVRPR